MVYNDNDSYRNLLKNRNCNDIFENFQKQNSVVNNFILTLNDLVKNVDYQVDTILDIEKLLEEFKQQRLNCGTGNHTNK